MATESLYGALAIRMMQILDLPKNFSFNRLEREIEVRGEESKSLPEKSFAHFE